jgi:hypothetical protein
MAHNQWWSRSSHKVGHKKMRNTPRRCSRCSRPNRRQQSSLTTYDVGAATALWLRSRAAFSFVPQHGVLPSQLSSSSDLALLPPPETFSHLHLYRTLSHIVTSTMAIQTSNAVSLANPQPPNTLRVTDLPHIQTLPLDVIAEIIAYVRQC